MSDQDRLEELYYLIGDTNGKVSDDVFAEVEHLENILNPSPLLKPLYAYRCDCGHCWECACRDNPEDI
jgi:hypothetical protein